MTTTLVRARLNLSVTRYSLPLLVSLAGLLPLLLVPSRASEPQAKINAQIVLISTWAAQPVVIEAVRAHNAQLAAAEIELTEKKWAALPVLDPFIRNYANSPAGKFLRAKRSEVIVEAFLSDAAGLKVSFINKPSFWSHAGKPKHEIPMSGKPWQGRVELDQSTGLRQLQISVPVLDDGKPIGSLVVGLSLSILEE